jgi:hypothetical protein
LAIIHHSKAGPFSSGGALLAINYSSLVVLNLNIRADFFKIKLSLAKSPERSSLKDWTFLLLPNYCLTKRTWLDEHNGFEGCGAGELIRRQFEMSHPTALKTRQDTSHRSIRGQSRFARKLIVESQDLAGAAFILPRMFSDIAQGPGSPATMERSGR